MHPNPSRFHSPIVHFHFRSKYFPQVRPNDTVASEFQPSQALAESRRLWISKNAPSDYQRIYSSVRGPVASRYSSSPDAGASRMSAIPCAPRLDPLWASGVYLVCHMMEKARRSFKRCQLKCITMMQ